MNNDEKKQTIMARPRKFRSVCFLPNHSSFGPLNKICQKKVVLMSVEEYESIRLIDFEGLMQEQCAERMNVARTTVQRIYTDARRKLADSLINGMVLKIEGGDYSLNDSRECRYRCRICHKPHHDKEQ